jgi:predicted DNA-binding ribbon-helix-helix protein
MQQAAEIVDVFNSFLNSVWFPLGPPNGKGLHVSISRLVNRNVVAERGRTSMRLEPELWDALHEICEREAKDMSSLVREIETTRPAGGRTSAVRVFIMSYFRAAATELGHAGAGHGPPMRSRLMATRSAA